MAYPRTLDVREALVRNGIAASLPGEKGLKRGNFREWSRETSGQGVQGERTLNTGGSRMHDLRARSQR